MCNSAGWYKSFDLSMFCFFSLKSSSFQKGLPLWARNSKLHQCVCKVCSAVPCQRQSIFSSQMSQRSWMHVSVFSYKWFLDKWAGCMARAQHAPVQYILSQILQCKRTEQSNWNDWYFRLGTNLHWIQTYQKCSYSTCQGCKSSTWSEMAWFATGKYPNRAIMQQTDK